MTDEASTMLGMARPNWSRPGTGRASVGAPGRVRLSTLVLIRWVAVAGQLAAILLLHFIMDYRLSVLYALGAVAASALLNVVISTSQPFSRRLTDNQAALFLAYDILQLGALLYLTGGLQNPFALLFLAPVTVSATILSLRSTILIVLLVLAATAVLAVFHLPLPWPEPGIDLPQLYLFGLWVGVSMGVIFVSIYVSRITAEARRMSDALTESQFALGREQRVSELGSLAAATAHELGTPLSTIATVAREIVLEAPEGTLLAEDAALISREAKRCREILGAMSRRPGSGTGSKADRRGLADLLRAAAARYHRDGIQVEIIAKEGRGEPEILHTPELVHGLGNFVQNAVDFATSKVTIRAEVGETKVQVRVSDDGPGFRSDILRTLGEPYISSRPDSGGLGLGVFISMTLLERTGASIQFSNPDSGGAQVVVTWDRSSLDPTSEQV
jgi:two-component system, sensor histidine kinase RegB